MGIARKGEPLRFVLKTILPHKDKVDCLIWPYGRSGGYGIIKYRGRTRVVSRVVCRTVRGKPPTPRHEARHRCGKGNEGCVNPHHLRWSTHKRNMADIVKHGTSTKGEKSTRAKLTDRKVLKMRALHEDGWTYKALASKFSVAYSTVVYVIQRRTWTHI